MSQSVRAESFGFAQDGLRRAGGLTPWGSWLTCEETLDEYEQTHGWIFEVPTTGPVKPIPLKAMGRFVHEAVAVDPDTGIVYQTEDHRTAGFYRFLPYQYGLLHQGRECGSRPDLGV